MLASSGTAGDATRCRSLGVAGIVTKPVTRGDLVGTLSRVLGGADAESRPEQPATTNPERRAGLRLRILLAEDNAVNRLFAMRLLQKQGHSVQAANDGAEAVASFERERFDVILMDVQMPVMDGIAATRTIRKKETQTGTRIPIIALTAHAMSGDRERLLACGMDGYVTKPIRTNELFAALDEIQRAEEQPAGLVPAGTAGP
jgi:CheY-like chemotaxis protein